MKVKTTTLTPITDGQVIIHHSQTVRQSCNYNSAETSYGVTLTVLDNEAAIRKGVARAERLVEAPLNLKVAEQTQRLQGGKVE